MKKTLIALGFATIAGSVPGAYAAEAEVDSIAGSSAAVVEATQGQPLQLSLDDCLTIALSENPSVRVADMDITRVDYSRWETVSQLLPQISFAGSYNRMLEKQVMYMNMDMSSFLPGGGTGGEGGESAGADDTPASRAAKKNDGGIKVGLDNSYQIGFNASLPIIAPQLWASLKITDYQIYEAAEKARASRIDLINSVEKAYYGLMLAIDSRKVLQDSYDMAKFTYDMYTKQYQLGAASEFDVLRTQVAMQNIEPSIMQADLAIRQAKLSLLLLMGIDSAVDFDITGSLKDYEATMYEDALNIDRDFSDNTSLVQFDLQAKQLDQMLKVEKASLYPTLAGTAMYNWTSSTNGTPFKWRWNPYSVVGLSLNVPIFTGGKRYARIKEAKIQIEEMDYNRQNLTRSLAMQVDLAYDNIKVNISKIESCVNTVGQATRAHDIMAESFKIGAASYLNLRDSELALTQSQLAYYQAIYDLLVSRSELDKLLGNRAPHVEYQKMKK